MEEARKRGPGRPAGQEKTGGRIAQFPEPRSLIVSGRISATAWGWWEIQRKRFDAETFGETAERYAREQIEKEHPANSE